MYAEFEIAEFEQHLIQLDRSPVTISGYLGDLKLFFEWCDQTYDGPITLAHLTKETIREYRQHLLMQNARPSTINRRIAALASFANWARQAGYLQNNHNPVQGVRSVRETRLAPRWLDRKEQATLLRTIEKEVAHAALHFPRLQFQYLRDAAIVITLLNTGLRVSELAALCMGDVLLSERKGKVIVRRGKGVKLREVPLNTESRKSLWAYLNERPNVQTDAFFIGQRGEGIRERTVRRAVDRFAKPAGLESVSPHTLRHSFAKTLVDKGVSMEKVAALLGHSDLNTTRIYITPSEADLEEAVGTLGVED